MASHPRGAVTIHLTIEEIAKLDSLVDSGKPPTVTSKYYSDRADAVRSAVRRMIGTSHEYKPRRPPLEQARKEVKAYLAQHGTAYPSDIADALEMEFDFVIEVLASLADPFHPI